MSPGKNTTYISYCLLEAPEGSSACLHLVPLMAWKDYHSEMHPREDTAYSGLAFACRTGRARNQERRSRCCMFMSRPLDVTQGYRDMDIYVSREDGSSYPDTSFDSQATGTIVSITRGAGAGSRLRRGPFCAGMFTATLPVGETLVVTATVEPETPASPQESWNALVERPERPLPAGGAAG